MATTTKKAPAKKAAAPKTPRAAKPKAEKALGASEAKVYAMDGSSKNTIALPADLFGAQWNADLVHQVVVGMQANARPVIANVKNRGEVRGGGKKPWKQKGTGRARHGSTRSPIWKGGGVTHGPTKDRIFAVKINKKMRMAALLSVLSKKAKDGEIIFVEKVAFDAPKTKDAVKMLSNIAKAAGAEALVTKSRNAAIIAFAESNANAKKSLRNIGNVALEEVRNLNPVDLLTHKYLVLEDANKALEVLASRAK
jgi:large subunit ribosomal protein L4